MSKKSITFSPEVATISAVTNKAIERSIQQSIGIGHTDYCILQQLYMYDKKVKSTVFQEFLLLKPNSVSSALTRLEKKNMVKKELNEEDLRTFVVQITDTGKEAAKQASQAIREELTRLSWEDPDDMRINWGMGVHASLYYEDKTQFKDIQDDENFLNLDLGKDVFVVPGWVNGIKLLQQLWCTILKEEFQLSFSEYRILAYLSANEEGVFSGDIGRHLFLDKSVVSSFIKKLKKRKLVTLQANESDKRFFDVSITPEGRRVEQEVVTLLNEATAKHFDTLPLEMVDKQNQWHLDMYEALYRDPQ